MKNDLLKSMSIDMNITPFQGETDESYIYRLCYSALGQWCLSIAKNVTGMGIGTTKHNQTIMLNKLLLRYKELFPGISKRFDDISDKELNISVSIRKIYEETGYLLTDDNNRNTLANFGRSIKIGNNALLFGLPGGTSTVNGLGVFSSLSHYVVGARDFLIRDRLTYEEYFQTKFDPIDFFDMDIDVEEFEFFNPLSTKAPSRSWSRSFSTDYSVARKTNRGPYYRVMKTPDGIQLADEAIEDQYDSFISQDYRRLYFSIRAHYGNPLKATILKLDHKYSKIKLGGYLPNREYYFLLLLAWPEYNAFDKINFVIRNDFLEEVCHVLEHIGIKIKGGYKYE